MISTHHLDLDPARLDLSDVEREWILRSIRSTSNIPLDASNVDYSQSSIAITISIVSSIIPTISASIHAAISLL